MCLCLLRSSKRGNMRTAKTRIVNVRYKNVVRNEKFAKNELQLEMKKVIDDACSRVGKPTGYFIAVFGADTNQNMYRAYNFTPECPVGAWQAADIIKNSI